TLTILNNQPISILTIIIKISPTQQVIPSFYIFPIQELRRRFYALFSSYFRVHGSFMLLLLISSSLINSTIFYIFQQPVTAQLSSSSSEPVIRLHASQSLKNGDANKTFGRLNLAYQQLSTASTSNQALRQQQTIQIQNNATN